MLSSSQPCSFTWWQKTAVYCDPSPSLWLDLLCTRSMYKVVLRREINNSKATLDLKPFSAQCMSNLVRWNFQTVKWCKLKQNIKEHISYVKCFHTLDMNLCNPLIFVIHKQKKQSQGYPSQNTPPIMHLLWQIQKIDYMIGRFKYKMVLHISQQAQLEKAINRKTLLIQ